MRLSLIGMSGSGKTYWSKEFAKQGFKRFSCDDMIRERLAPEMKQPDGTILGLGRWMGFPYQDPYKEREEAYLNHEKHVLEEILSYLADPESDMSANIVIDTTGSVIYTGEEKLMRLRKATIVVHFETPPQAQQAMLEKYLTNKRPVLWRDMFDKQPGETNDEALARCYASLLSSREVLYQQIAHVTIPYHQQNLEDFGLEDFFRLISQR